MDNEDFLGFIYLLIFHPHLLFDLSITIYFIIKDLIKQIQDGFLWCMLLADDIVRTNDISAGLLELTIN